MATHPILDCAGVTHPGQVRQRNEDRFLTAAIERRLLVREASIELPNERRSFGALQGYMLAVADGIGGQPGGQYASEMVVETFAEQVLNAMPCLHRGTATADCGIDRDLRQALQGCHAKLLRFAREHPEYEGLGTTLTVALIVWPTLHVLHVGDSRCYVLSAGRLTRITTDQTVAQDLVDCGLLPAEGASGSRWGHMLLNAVDDRQGPLEPHVYDTAVSAGDTILLCSDGLTAHLPEAAVSGILAAATTAREAAAALVQAANDAGGTDNITVVVAKSPAPPRPR